MVKSEIQRHPNEKWHPVLRLVADVKPEEVRPALILTFNFFLLFTAYYVLKPIREGLILSMNGGAELKSSATAVQALLFILLVPLYSRLADRFSGRGILAAIYLFMAANILILMTLGLMTFTYLGVVYFIWIGFFNMLTISQTWSLCNDIFSPEAGKRVFALIGFGAAAGAALGSMVLRSAVPVFGLYKPMIIAAALLTICAALVWFGVPARPPLGKRRESIASDSSRDLLGGLTMVFRNRYVMLVATLIFLTNLINTNSEYMLGRLVADHFGALIPEGPIRQAALRTAIGEFYASFFFWVNIVVVVAQGVAVSRIIKHLGVKRALFIMPILALFSYLSVLFLPLLAVVRLVKITENSTDYSLNNTVREILYLPLTTDEKYKAKLAADTIFRRIGDALSKPIVFVVVEVLGIGISGFSGVNLLLVLIWFWLVWKIGVKRGKMMRLEPK